VTVATERALGRGVWPRRIATACSHGEGNWARTSVHRHVRVRLPARATLSSAAANSSIEAADERHAAFDPVGFRFIRRQPDAHNKIGGVSCCRQYSSPFTRLIDRCVVVRICTNVVRSLGSQPYVWPRHKQLLWIRFSQHHFLIVPPSTFDVQPICKNSICRPQRRQRIVLRQTLEVKPNRIDGDRI